jgi:hypothetical protein
MSTVANCLTLLAALCFAKLGGLGQNLAAGWGML